jgi:hypothetical protein
MLIDYLSKYFDAKAMDADWAGFTAICLCSAKIACSAIAGASENLDSREIAVNVPQLSALRLIKPDSRLQHPLL